MAEAKAEVSSKKTEVKKEEEEEVVSDFAINAAKYEMLRLFLDVLLSTNE